MLTHSKKSAFNRWRFYFEIILIAATPCYFFLFHCINKREVRPASLGSMSFRASSSKRLLSYTFIMYIGFNSTLHLHICWHTPTGNPSSIREPVGLGEFEIVVQTRNEVEGLHNEEFS